MSAPAAHRHLTACVLEDQTGLSLMELCRACATEPDRVMALVDEGLLIPSGSHPPDWRFTGLHMQRVRVALRLQDDLGVNLAGAVLALQLIDELDRLRARLQRFEGSAP